MTWKKRLLILLLAAALLVAVVCASIFAASKAAYIYREMRTKLENIDKSTKQLTYNAARDNNRYSFDYSWLDENCLIAHALGGIDGVSSTNSLEALVNAYENGHRVFEGDLQLIDGRVVVLHDGAEHIIAMGLDPANYSYEDFMQARIKGKYTPMNAADIVRFLSEHPDAYFMTDSKYTENPYSVNVLSGFVISALEIDPSVLDRVIVQIYNQDMLETVMDIYPFKSVVYTLYQSMDSNEDAIAFCLRTGVNAITIPDIRAPEEVLRRLDTAGIYALTHTVNDEESIMAFFAQGVDAVYTDFAAPSMFE